MASSLRDEFGRLVRHHRLRAKLTQLELAERADLSLEMVGRIERGEVGTSLESIEKLSAALDTPAREFFGAGAYAVGKRPGKLGAIVAKLAPLKPDELDWIARLLDVALRRVGGGQ